MQLLIEAHSGVAGDMLTAALLDLGIDHDAWLAELRKLGLPEEWTSELTRQSRHGITGNHIRFLVGGRPIDEPFLSSTAGHRHLGHDEGTGHAHEHGGEHPRTHPHEATEPEHHGRDYAAIRDLVRASAIAEGAKRRALAVFERIGIAEAKLHGVELEAVHFHEVGGLDAILDICGVAVALEMLGVDKMYALPLPMGLGTVKTSHGMLPLPAPATAEILKGFPIRRVDFDFELVTPTGAALVAALASPEAPVSYRVEKIGYGLGTRDDPRIANVLRVFSVSAEAPAPTDEIIVLEATLDDATPEWIAALFESLRSAGALDVFAAPAYMKKGRLGSNLTVLSRVADADRLTNVMFTESTTIGVRRRAETRTVLPRRAGRVATPWGDVEVKIVVLPDGRSRATPEFESCARLAAEAGVPLLEVYRSASAAEVPDEKD